MSSLPMMEINLKRMIKNFQTAQSKCDALGIKLRPHLKTLHRPEYCESLRELGLQQICVSNLTMLSAFLNAGWRDICLAMPCSPHWISQLNDYLADYSCEITLYVDHRDQVAALNGLNQPVNVMIEVDAGQARSGVHWKHESTLLDLIDQLNRSNHHFTGLTSHFGHHYQCENKDEVMSEMAHSMMRILQLKEHLELALNESLPLSVGDTPSFLAMNFFDQVTEIRAGNFLLNDLTMHAKGVCEFSHLACALRSSVISKFDTDLRVVVHAGAVHLSNEKHPDPDVMYGWIGWPSTDFPDAPIAGGKIIELYQEHAVITLPKLAFDRIEIGHELLLFPVHSCLAVDAMSHKQQVTLLG